MPDLDALYTAVVDAPLADAPRLVYADAIEATDPQRAELIRIQVEIGRCRRTRTWVQDGLYIREHQLIYDHGKRWAENVVGLASSWQYLRGFVDVVEIDAALFLARGPDLYRRAPVVHLNLTGVKPVARALFDSPLLARILSIGLLRNELGDDEAEIIARSPQLSNLTWINLGLNQIGERGLEALVASDRLPKLGYLGFMTNPAPDPTPVHADGYDADSIAARDFQAKYGRREWLSAHERGTWPPHRDAVWPE